MKMTTKAALAAMVFFMATTVSAMASNSLDNDVPGAFSIILAGHGNGHGHGNGGNGGKGGNGTRDRKRDGSCQSAVTAHNATLILAGNGHGPGDCTGDGTGDKDGTGKGTGNGGDGPKDGSGNGRKSGAGDCNA